VRLGGDDRIFAFDPVGIEPNDKRLNANTIPSPRRLLPAVRLRASNPPEIAQQSDSHFHYVSMLHAVLASATTADMDRDMHPSHIAVAGKDDA
jgi:hypothetical protein